MGAADPVPLPNSQSDIVSSVTDILKHHRSKSRWNHLRSIYPEGFRSSELIRILLSLRNRAHLALRLFSWSARLRRPDLAAHATIIHILARAGLSTRAQTILGTTLACEDEDSKPGIFETLAATYRNCDSRPFVFDLLVRTCLASGRTDRAVDIVRRLLSRGLRTTIGTCNSLLRHAVRSAGADEGLRLYGEIFPHESENRTGSGRWIETNVQTFNSLLHSLYREDWLEAVDRVVSEMRKRGCEPNLFTYNVLMAAFSDAGQIGKSMELWGQMLEKGIEPDSVSFSTLISAFCRVGEVTRGEELYMSRASLRVPVYLPVRRQRTRQTPPSPEWRLARILNPIRFTRRRVRIHSWLPTRSVPVGTTLWISTPPTLPYPSDHLPNLYRSTFPFRRHVVL